MHFSRRKGAISTSFWLFTLCINLLVSQSHAQNGATSATLNSPATATSTGATQSSNPNATSPATTSTIPLSLSPQRVPYLLNQPDLKSKNRAGRGTYFTGCSDSASVGYVEGKSRLNISTVYTQFDRFNGDSALGNGNSFSAGSLRIVGIGTLGNESYAFNSFTDSTGFTRGLLSAIQATTRFSTFQIFSNYTYLCDRIYPTQNDSQHPTVQPSSCQFGPGTVAFGIDIPLNSSYDAGTLTTQIRLTDSSSPALTITCIEVRVSPYNSHRWYWDFIFWFPLALTISYSILSFFARLITAETSQRKVFKNRAREGAPPRFLQGRLSPIVAAALSGREIVLNAGLVRYVTPGCWDVIFTLQYFVAIAMCHVQWPDFAYPFLRQAAWSSLLGNITLTQPAEQRIDPLATNATLPSGDIADQMNNAISPLYMNSSQPNSLLNLGGGDDDGIITFSKMIGLQPQNLFGTCLGIWLILVAVIVVASVFSWIVDYVTQAHDRFSKRREGVSLPNSSSNPAMNLIGMEKGKSVDSGKARLSISGARNSLILGSSWSSATGFHGKALHGNLLRLLLLFHLPITIVSTYQFASTSNHSSVSIGLAALSFTILSLLLPIYILARIATTPLQKLYEHFGTLLALGPAYYLYSPGSQLFCTVSFAHSLILGIAVGAGQRSGTSQASIIIVVEIFAALASSLWLPWSEGAMMGPLSFMTNVLRIIMAILLLLLTDSVGFSYSARTWLTYVILLLMAIYLLGAFLVFLVKFIEAMVRLIWKVSFDEQVATRTAGLGGAIRKIQRRKFKGQGPAGRRPQSDLQSQRIRLHQRASSASTNTMAPILAHPQSIPMSHSRSSTYGDFLGSTTGRPPISSMGSRRNIDEDYGPIMAALPPLSPTHGPNSRLASTTDGGFVRIGGGRATEENPYATRPTPPLSPSVSFSPQNARPQSQAGHVGSWGDGRQSKINTNHSYFALAKAPSHELSSTQAAALSASQSLAMRQGQNQGKKKVTPITARNSPGNEEDWSDEEGTTWDSDLVAREKGTWSGVAKMSAALSNMKRKVIGDKGQTVDTEEGGEEDNDFLNSSGNGGFEIIRPTRLTRPASKLPLEQSKKEEAVEASSKPIMQDGNSTRQFYGSDQQYSDAMTPTIHLTSSSPSKPEKGSSLPSPSPSTSPPPPPAPAPMTKPGVSSRGPLGMLAADVPDITSSADHTAEEVTEERFWLPPLDIQINKQENSLL